MDLVTMTLGLPLAPVRGLLALARVLAEQAEQELYNPSLARRELEEIEAAESDEEIPDDVAEDAERQVIDRLVQP